jgi:hypothetical protein
MRKALSNPFKSSRNAVLSDEERSTCALANIGYLIRINSAELEEAPCQGNLAVTTSIIFYNFAIATGVSPPSLRHSCRMQRNMISEPCIYFILLIPPPEAVNLPIYSYSVIWSSFRIKKALMKASGLSMLPGSANFVA